METCGFKSFLGRHYRDAVDGVLGLKSKVDSELERRDHKNLVHESVQGENLTL